MKLPYSSLNQLGIVFKDLPADLKDAIPETPKDPEKYGPAQLRKLWHSKDKWQFIVSPQTLSQSAATSTVTQTSNSVTLPATTLQTTSTTVQATTPLADRL